MKKDRSNTFNVCFVISIVLHVLVILLIPASWSSGGGLSIYAVEPYGISDGNPFETSIAYTEAQQSKTATASTKTTVTTQAAEPKKAEQPKPATTPKSEPPKQEVPKSEPPKVVTPSAPVPTSERPKETAPAKAEVPKASTPEPPKVDVNDTVTTTNQDAEISVPVEESAKKEPEPEKESEPIKEPESKELESEQSQGTDSTDAQTQGEEASGGSDIGQGEAEVPPAPKTVTVKGSSLFLGGFGIVYPKDAVAEKAKGIVKLAISVGPDGSLTRVDVVQSSGYQSLDEHAIDRVSQGPFKVMGQAYILPAEVTFTDVGMNAKVDFGDVVFRED